MDWINKRERNVSARMKVESVSSNYGIRYEFIAKKMEMHPSNFCNWKKGNFEFGVNKLSKIESITNMYR